MPPGRIPPVPAVLRLVQRTVLHRWRATDEDLYREVAALAEAAPRREMLVAGCGEGETTEWLAARTGATVTGVDADAMRIAAAEARAARSGARAVHYEQAALDDLPHETGVFDAAVGDLSLSAAADPERAVAELARVVKPMGVVVLMQLTWTSEIASDAREQVVDRLGLRPHLIVEWKQMMRDAGLVDLQVQDWTDGVPGGRASAPGAEHPRLTLRQKAHIVGRAWRRWGWRAARGAVERETSLIRELSRERAFGFLLMKGVKWPHAKGA
ncbi:MAG TPA: class I SAM-dependent methyltransferase [Gemmatimonadaceae bacterium]|nr:class I SAM-dependent methyltransferase [Gemmatimonadaceae bacterium]